MPIADSKKVQTLVNVIGQQTQVIRDAVDKIKEMRTTFTAVSPDVTGTPLEGNLAAVNSAIDSLDTEIAGPVWTGMIDAICPSHRNKALE